MALAVPVDREARNIPFFVDYFYYQSIATDAYSPTEDASFDANELGIIEANGFLVRPDTDGALYGITLYDYKNNLNPVTKVPYLTGLVPQQYLGVANQWIECRFVKIYAQTTGALATRSASANINVGITI